jgi:predicted transcriptional regulator
LNVQQSHVKLSDFPGEFLAEANRNLVVLRKALQPVRTEDIMIRECPIVSIQDTVSHLISDHILTTGQRYCLIVDGDKLEGAVTIENVKRLPKRHRDSRLAKVMTPVSQLKLAYPRQSAASVLGQMDEQWVDYMPVLENDRIVGIISRESLEHLAQTRNELKS